MTARFVLAALALAACASNPPLPERTVSGAPQLDVPDDGSKLLFDGLGEGVQIYTCAVDGGAAAWTLKAPDASVGDVHGARLRHFAGPTWAAADGSSVVGDVKARAAIDASAIPWLLLAAKSTSGDGLLSRATWIQRLETHGGKPPQAGCDAAHAGAEQRVEYSAVYRIWGR